MSAFMIAIFLCQNPKIWYITSFEFDSTSRDCFSHWLVSNLFCFLRVPQAGASIAMSWKMWVTWLCISHVCLCLSVNTLPSQAILVSESEYVRSELLVLQNNLKVLEERGFTIEKDIRVAMAEGSTALLSWPLFMFVLALFVCMPPPPWPGLGLLAL